MAMNFEQARQNMVENQVRPAEVLDFDVLDTLKAVRREDFVAPEHRNVAFADLTLPIGHGEVMMKPVIEGRTLQAVALNKTDEVLEIGTGTGYLTACLAHLAGKVTSIDMHADFVEAARQRLAAAGITNVTLATAEAVNGYDPKAVFDAIVVTGAVHAVPEKFVRWLKPGGRMFVVRGDSPAQTAVLLTHEGDGRYREESLLETDLPYLAHAAPVKRFVL
ncbi:protein-L-isoaspartate(D-aspartate) O-methyltransferase [Luteibacter sp. UNC138MFCol5.1]|uniref:protein-L-isoaspartate O-methyltransferase family protein n=1 Tax=Luteibacter sp. UNC138MFCol5.1 TaxID=1502774 RepID=UPI0008CD5377|nr:protein-L-isoaspartate O-methyltransferase [Luteibacter sp. UNC138MFCol5.1]SEO98369.1 protein-L-isoaspartate(D-aspartate) O-methyltransferase [Luteibacter sp. UNC138MFCol5.1]